MGDGEANQEEQRLGTLSGVYIDPHPPPGSTDGPGKPDCSVGTFHLAPCWTVVPEGRAARVSKGDSRAKDRRPPRQRSAKHLAVVRGTEGKVSAEILRENRAVSLGRELLGVWCKS